MLVATLSPLAPPSPVVATLPPLASPPPSRCRRSPRRRSLSIYLHRGFAGRG